MQPRALDEKVAPIQEAETAIFMDDLLRDPSGFYNHVKRTTASTANIVVWGHRGPTYDDFWGSVSLRPPSNPFKANHLVVRVQSPGKVL